MSNLDNFLTIRNVGSTGTIDITSLPTKVKTIKVEVANMSALLLLTLSSVQNGDIVRVVDIDHVYMVTDDTALNNISGYTLLVKPNAENIEELENLSKINDHITQVKGGAFVLSSPATIKTDLSLVKSDVGLDSVDNTSDTNKPISTATQNALDTKEDIITAGTTSQYYRGDKSFQTLDKSTVGLANINNVDNTNASNISNGTLANQRLSTNLAQIGDDTFANGEIIQSFDGTLQNATLGVGVTGATVITNTAGSILFDVPYAKGPLNQKSGFFEDFITYSNKTISPYFERTLNGGGSAVTIAPALSSGDTRLGVLVFSTGSNNSGRAAITSNLSLINFGNIPDGGYEEVGASFMIPIISDATQSFRVIFGFGDNASGLVPTNGSYVSVGSGTTGFQGNTCMQNTQTTNTSLLTPVTNTIYNVCVRVSNIGGTLSSSYYVNGTQLGTAITSNIPSGADSDVGIQFGIVKSLGTAPRSVELDWIYYESFKPRTINY